METGSVITRPAIATKSGVYYPKFYFTGVIMTGCVALRKDTYYVRLTYYDINHKRKDKWISTGLSGRGAKQKATAMINSFIDKQPDIAAGMLRNWIYENDK